MSGHGGREHHAPARRRATPGTRRRLARFARRLRLWLGRRHRLSRPRLHRRGRKGGQGTAGRTRPTGTEEAARSTGFGPGGGAGGATTRPSLAGTDPQPARPAPARRSRPNPVPQPPLDRHRTPANSGPEHAPRQLTCGDMKMIQIRDVPEAVHRALKERAAREGTTLSDLIMRDLPRIARQADERTDIRAPPRALEDGGTRDRPTGRRRSRAPRTVAVIVVDASALSTWSGAAVSDRPSMSHWRATTCRTAHLRSRGLGRPQAPVRVGRDHRRRSRGGARRPARHTIARFRTNADTANLGLRGNFTPYDASYLALAEASARRDRLLTADRRFARAARKHSDVEVLLAT